VPDTPTATGQISPPPPVLRIIGSNPSPSRADAQAFNRRASSATLDERRRALHFANEATGGNGRSEQLEQIIEMLSSAPQVQSDLAHEIRGKIDRGEYQTEAKLNFAIYRMLKDILD